MAQRRMFALKIIDSDAFLDMPMTSQLLYFHLNMRADDDGFVGNPKRIMKMLGSTDDDLKVLMGKRFVLAFESGVIVIKHWRMNNLIRKDFYQETQYLEEKEKLYLKENKAYTDNPENGEKLIVNNLLTQYSIGKDSIGKDIESGKATPSQEMNQFLESDEYLDRVAEYICQKKSLPKDFVVKELKSFKGYWSERNKSGTKQRWELEKTFELSRRITTWFANLQKFNKTKTIQSL